MFCLILFVFHWKKEWRASFVASEQDQVTICHSRETVVPVTFYLPIFLSFCLFDICLFCLLSCCVLSLFVQEDPVTICHSWETVVPVTFYLPIFCLFVFLSFWFCLLSFCVLPFSCLFQEDRVTICHSRGTVVPFICQFVCLFVFLSFWHCAYYLSTVFSCLLVVLFFVFLSFCLQEDRVTILHSRGIVPIAFSLPSDNVANCPDGQWTVWLWNNNKQQTTNKVLFSAKQQCSQLAAGQNGPWTVLYKRFLTSWWIGQKKCILR